MTRVLWTVVTTAAIATLALEAAASGVGASIYVERPEAAPCPNGGCAPVGSCATCQRLGFACVDHATPAPCTAEGGCYPARPTFGWNKTNWRRWPGTDLGGPAPEPAGIRDELVPPFEEPAPEDEDVQAPAAIEDEGDTSSDEGEVSDRSPVGTRPPAGARPAAGSRPGGEINLPSLPEPQLPRPGLRPNSRPGAQPAGEDGPPALPFGFRAPTGPGGPGAWAPPQPPLGGIPASLPRPSNETPPPLPQGFTAVGPTATPRRLPATSYYDDRAVQPASASLPAYAPRR